MAADDRLSTDVQKLLRCPVCHAALRRGIRGFGCTNADCRAEYPTVDGIPVILDEASSLFRIADFVSRRSTLFQEREGRLKTLLLRLVPSVGNNLRAEQNYRRFAGLLLERSAAPRVLVIGGRILGLGMEVLLDFPSIELVESDLSFGPRTALICDAHTLPFEDKSFDGVVVQAVLEHVVDPRRCVEEAHRVLREDGLVYAETPFMQQVHGGPYDFTRFTHLGHRRLFRAFEEIDSGAAGGPGMALAWSYQYFLMSLAVSRAARALLFVVSSFTAFFLKYLDYLLIRKPGALDAASGYFFLGKKSERSLPDRDLVLLYRGAIHGSGII